VVPAVFTVFDDIERWMAPRASKLLAQPELRERDLAHDGVRTVQR
jgi:hypothetical protein